MAMAGKQQPKRALLCRACARSSGCHICVTNAAYSCRHRFSQGFSHEALCYSPLRHCFFQFAMIPYENWQRLAWAGVLIIIAAVLGLKILARIIARNK